MPQIKVLIVDDSALVRQTFKTLLETDPEISVVATASDPYIAVQKIQKEKPDVITLDIQMPRMDGLTFLKRIMTQAPMPVVVISSQTAQGADVALKALEIGAVDVMNKPNMASDHAINESRIGLTDVVRSAYFARRPVATTSFRERQGSREMPKKVATNVTPPVVGNDYTRFKPHVTPYNTIIGIGASTGGTEAIRVVLRSLPPQMPPIVMVQHMPEKFTTSFAKSLNDNCSLHVKEAADGDPVLPNTVYLAPGGNHMAVVHQAGRLCIKIHQGELVNRHRPSVNVLFNSLAELNIRNSIGVILTGMGDDGATGLAAMHGRGAYTIAQDEATSIVFGMPGKAIQTGGVSEIAPLEEIFRSICERLFATAVEANNL